MQLDELDLKILNYLLEHEKQDYNKMAEQFSTTSKTIFLRMKRLRENKVIEGISVKINNDLIGYNLGAVFLIKLVDNSKVSNFAKRYEQKKEIVVSYVLTGICDVMFVLKVNNPKIITDFLYKLTADKDVNFADLFYITHSRLERMTPFPLE